MNAVIRHTETDDVTQTNLLWQQPFGLQYKLERRKEKEERNITNLTRDFKRLGKKRQEDIGGGGK